LQGKPEAWEGKMHAWMSPHQKQVKVIAMPFTIDAML